MLYYNHLGGLKLPDPSRGISRLIKRAFALFSIYLIFISFLPLISDVMGAGRWNGYGWGAYDFNNGVLDVRFSDLTYGGDKPKLSASPYPLMFQSKYVDVIEVSDHESFINGNNMYYDFQVARIIITDEETITYIYVANVSGEGLIVSKTTSIPFQDAIVIVYSAPREVHFRISLWRWYYESVNNITFESFGQASEKRLENAENATFTFFDREFGRFHAIVFFSRPVNMTICRDDKGINKFIVEARSQNLTFTIHVYVAENRKISPLTAFFRTLLSIKALHFLLPPLTTICVYLGWKKWVRRLE